MVFLLKECADDPILGYGRVGLLLSELSHGFCSVKLVVRSCCSKAAILSCCEEGQRVVAVLACKPSSLMACFTRRL